MEPNIVSAVNDVILYGFGIGAASGFIFFFVSWLPSAIFKLINRTL